ncbi:MAG: AbfB domain-containing protein [Candidatus Paceibacterota bacterium]|jgi:hypothetical protein
MKTTLQTTLALLATTCFLPAATPELVEILLESIPQQGIAVQKDKAAEISSKRTSKFKILPGLTSSSLVSLEPLGSKGFFLRHQNSVLFLHERPKQNGLFDADASFKMIDLGSDKVRFEASNYPGMFITGKDDGSLITMSNPPLDKSTFILKRK